MVLKVKTCDRRWFSFSAFVIFRWNKMFAEKMHLYIESSDKDANKCLLIIPV